MGHEQMRPATVLISAIARIKASGLTDAKGLDNLLQVILLLQDLFHLLLEHACQDQSSNVQASRLTNRFQVLNSPLTCF